MRSFLFLLFFCLVSTSAFAGVRDETRYCGVPPRDADGSLYRSSGVRAAFKKAHPCPVTNSSDGACLGWYIDHVIPLACGGCDAVSNMQWLPEVMWKAKTKWERKIYAAGGGVCK